MRLLLLVLLIVVATKVCDGQIQLPKLIGDNAVFQRDRPLKLFGSASANEAVRVDFNSSVYNTVAGDDGQWSIVMAPQPAGGPHQITFTGKNKVVLNNILFGDVWICSGQSNMELTMDRVADKYNTEIATSTNPSIRYFEVPDKYNFKNPETDLSGGKWLETNPETVRRFSAVAYFFAKDISTRHKVPIGLVNAAVGGSPAESWMSEDALQAFPHYLSEAKKFRDDNLISQIESSDRSRTNDWYKALAKSDRGSRLGWQKNEVDDRIWRTMRIPGYWEKESEVPNGSMWFRKKFNVDSKYRGKDAVLYLGRIVDQDSVFINGKFVGTTSYQYPPRRYALNPNILVEGENTIVVRVISQSGRGGFVEDKPYLIKINNDTLDLSGEWKYMRGASLPPLAGQTFIRWKPLGLYNAMIAPLQEFQITGVIWYQGEANTSRADEYAKLFPALVNDWRKGWNREVPFLFVQLPNFMEAKPEPQESDWAALRESQRQTISLPATGMAVAIDVGEWNDIHPFTKDVIGKRLALLARKNVYGENALIASGPQPLRCHFFREKIEVTFSDIGTGLVARNSERIYEVAISADGKKYYWADATVEGDRLVARHKNVKNPIAIRYAWSDNPSKANLYNAEGLPATPFYLKK